MKVIIKAPEEKIGHIADIKNELKTLQKIVGGYIEVIPLDETTVCICNEEGKLLNLEPNFNFRYDIICGTVIICSVKYEEFEDCQWSLEKWKKFIRA